MKDSTSINNINGDRPLNKAQKAVYLFLNQLDNNFFPLAAEPHLVVKNFGTDISRANWESIAIKASPSRKLCELFLIKLPWTNIKAALGQIKVFDTGCGSGHFGTRLMSFSEHSIDSYVGVDINSHPDWDKYKQQYKNFRFQQLNSADILNHIPEGTNFFITQSAVEHFDRDLLYFRQIRDFLLKTPREVIQVHLMPSSDCLRLYRFHGIRQYTPRTISKITRMFDGFSSSVLFNLGGKRCNSLHYEFITTSSKRDTDTEEYDRRLLTSIKADMQRPGKSPSFYALVIHSNGKKNIF